MKQNPYLAGVLYGDGTCHHGKNRAYAVWIDQIDRNKFILDRVVDELKKLGLNVHHYAHQNKFRALVYSKDFYNIFSSLRKDIVNFFENLTVNQKLEFISGFFDAEGTVTDRLVLYNGNLKLLKSIKRFFDSIDVISYIYRYGKIYGIQVYRKKSLMVLKEKLNSEKINKLILSG